MQSDYPEAEHVHAVVFENLVSVRIMTTFRTQRDKHKHRAEYADPAAQFAIPIQLLVDFAFTRCLVHYCDPPQRL